MITVVIQPSFGNADARRHWQDTMVQPVPFDSLRSALTPQTEKALTDVHPDARARFWGMTNNHDNAVDTLGPGDVVLFTGRKHVQGVGEIGVVLRDAALGDALWDPHPDRGSYSNVYSLRSFAPAQIPYEEIWELPGFNAGDNFMGARFLRGDKADDLLSGLRIETATSAQTNEQDAAQAVARAAEMLPDEALNVTQTTYETQARTLTVNRVEAQLVALYRAHLGVQTHRLRTAAGVTDLVHEITGGVEVVEAKAASTREAVRLGIGQVLDYVRYIPETRRMALLLPSAPAPDMIELANSLGISIVYSDEAAGFVRTDAAATTTENMLRSVASES